MFSAGTAPRMWYPICVSTCPQGEALLCPHNLNQETTTTSTTKTTANFYGSIRDARNGGLPYPPYPLPSVYQRYRSQHSFSDQPYLQPAPNYPPPIYPPGPPAGPWEGTPWPLGSVIYGLPRVLGLERNPPPFAYIYLVGGLDIFCFPIYWE